jgi:predicted RNase H-like HicB family nuclease
VLSPAICYGDNEDTTKHAVCPVVPHSGVHLPIYRWLIVERVIRVHVEKLPEGVYLATSDDIQGLVAQGRTVTETLEIARDVARKLIEAREERTAAVHLEPVGESFDYPLILAV